VCDDSSLGGVYYVSHRWTWDPGIILKRIWLLLEDKQYSSREDCNVPTLGHHHITEGYDDQSRQMEVIASTGIIERYFGVRLASLILFHHYDPFCTYLLWFRCIPMISMILSILSHKSIKFTEEAILGTILGGTSQCNSSLESEGTTLQDRMVRSNFTDAASRQQVQVPQVLQLDDPRVEDPIYIQGAAGMVSIVQCQHGDL
jgi:hypothetical protein